MTSKKGIHFPLDYPLPATSTEATCYKASG